MKVLSVIIFILAFVVIVLGATTRLKHAGLGCPDWPGCYGHLTVPDSHEEIGKGLLPYEASPDHKTLEPHKAWYEMIHRYVAGFLGLLIATNLILSITKKENILLSTILFIVVIFQAALGMWTVTFQLHPLVVMSHLTGGITILTLATVLVFRRFHWHGTQSTSGLVFNVTLFAAILLDVQVILGGWTSANYAALACPDFPTCQASFWPAMNFNDAFFSWMHFGKNYEYGVLETPARTAIHMMHRMGALVVTLFMGVAIYLSWRAGGLLRKIGFVALGFLILQISLGISNVIFSLPLPVAVLHNANAALLVQVVMVWLLFLRSGNQP